MKGKENSDAKEPTAKIESAGTNTRKCVVHLLNGQEFQCNVERNANGAQLLRQIRELLDIIEFDYFGLYYEDSAHQKYWLESEKSIKKQLKNSPWKFHLSVKFYPSDPSQLSEGMARYYMVLQMKDKIISGSLPCSFVTHALLGSFVVQSEMGDYDATSMKGNYVTGFQFAPNQTNALEEKVIELHKTHKGLTPEEADIAFLENVKKLPLYGVDQHAVKDSENIDLMLGVSWNGLRVYRDQVQINRFAWPRILKITYTRSKFHIQIRPVDDQIAESIVGFKLPNHKAAKRLWKSCVEHHTFFRMTKPKEAKPRLMRTGSKFRYTGQTQHQTRETVATTTRKNVPKIQRANSRRSYERSRNISSSESQSPPELPKKEHAETVTKTEVVTITEEVITEKVKEPPQPKTEVVEEVVTTTEETVEVQVDGEKNEVETAKTSSSSSLSSMSDEEMSALTKHQKKVHKMKPKSENEKTIDDGKFLQEPPPGSTGSSEWDLRLQSSPAKTGSESPKSDDKPEEPAERKEDVTVVTMVTTEVVEEVVTTKTREDSRESESSSSSSEEEEGEIVEEEPKVEPLPDFVPTIDTDESLKSSSSSSDNEEQNAEKVEPAQEDAEEPKQEIVMVHAEDETTDVVIENPNVEDSPVEEPEEVHLEEETPEEPETLARKDSTSSSSSSESSSDSGTEELKQEEPEETPPKEEPGETNENNNNNEDVEQEEREDVEVPQNVITTVETRSVRVEDVVIPREDNEVHKVSLTADQDNNVTVTETKSSTSSSSSSSSSSDSEPEPAEAGEDAPVTNGFKKPPIVETELVFIEPTEEEKPAVTTEPPVVHTETKTITYESSQHQPDVINTTNDVQLLSSQTITAETMSTVTTTHITKTVVGSVSETRVEKSIVITAEGDADIHQAMAEAIKDTQDSNPDVSITKVVVHEEKVVENP